MKRIGLTIILLSFAVPAFAGSRADALVNSFRVMCTLPDRTFESSDTQATAMNLPMIQDVEIPKSPNGKFLRSKSWVMTLKSGPHFFGVTEGNDGSGRNIDTCSIADNDIEGGVFAEELVKQLKLGKPAKVNHLGKGEMMTDWRWAGVDIMLREPAPSHARGFLLVMSATHKQEK